MRVAFEHNKTVCVREFDGLLPVIMTSVSDSMRPDKMIGICEQAAFISDKGKLFITFKYPRECCKYTHAISINYDVLWKYILQNGYIDLTREKIEFNNSLFFLDCELEYV